MPENCANMPFAEARIRAPALNGWPSSQSYAIPQRVSPSSFLDSWRLSSSHSCRSLPFPDFSSIKCCLPDSTSNVRSECDDGASGPVLVSDRLANRSAMAGSSRDCAARRRSWCVTDILSQRSDVLTLVIGAAGSSVQRLRVRFYGAWYELRALRRLAIAKRPSWKRRYRRCPLATTSIRSISDCGAWIWAAMSRWK